MARNTLAGKSTGTSRSAQYLRDNPEVKEKKLAYDKEYQKKKAQVKKRVETNSANRKAGTYGKMTAMGKDRSHTKKGTLVLEDRAANRARNGKGKDGKKLK